MELIFKKKKNNKTARQKADDNILRLVYMTVFLFLWLIGYVGYFLFARREEVINNTYNARLDNFARRVERGKILSSGREILAETQTGSDGRETRIYPYGSLFAHVVGYSTRGKTGIEELANYYLLTSHVNLVSQAAAELSGNKSPGDCIVTTLDTRIQQIAKEGLGDRKGAVVVMEPATGKVLAMVSSPAFDSNSVGDNWESLVAEDEGQAILLNRAAQGLYPPGSVFKIITLLEYIREHPTDYDQFRFECDGYYEYGDYTIQCYHGTAHGSQTLGEAFANSCNGAFASLGLELNLKSLADTASQLLFNSDQPMALAYKKSRFVMEQGADDWEILQTSIGQGMTQVTPLHMSLITAAIANNGTLMTPYFIDSVENTVGEEVKSFEPTIYGQLMTQEEAAVLKSMMTQVVTEGTGSAVRCDSYRAAGKTGSAQFETGKETHAWFTGFAPAEDPQVVVTVVVEEGGSGGQAAAPIARSIFDACISPQKELY